MSAHPGEVAAVQPAPLERTHVVTLVAGLLRVPEWAKNLFVFAPLLFSGKFLGAAAVWTILLVCLALCAVSSSVYIVNDLLDLARDREHPVKRHRPLASGAVSSAAGGTIAVALVVLGYALLEAARVPLSVLALTAGFLTLNAAYSLYLKSKVIADILTIASGYVLRVLIGGAAIGVPVTHWLILCTFLLATFLGFSKRRHELTLLGDKAIRHRPVLELYSKDFLDHVSLLTLAVTLTCYLLYTIAPETVERFGTTALVYSGLIVMFALFRYLFLIHIKKMGSPVEVLYFDRQIVLAVVAWVLYVVVVVYTWPALAACIR